MATETNPRPRRSVARRVARLASFGFYAGLLLWIAWLAVTRWNGVPADPSGAWGVAVFSPPIDPELDRTAELTAALAAFPTVPPVVLPPAPQGMRWNTRRGTSSDLRGVRDGEWTAETRPYLQTAIRYLQTPGVRGAVARVAAIAPGGWRPMGSQGPGMAGIADLRRAFALLVARARYYHAELGDIDAAFDELEVLYRLSSITTDSGDLRGMLTAMAYEGVANDELRHLAREHQLERSHLRRIIDIWRSAFLSEDELLQMAIECQLGGMERAVDLMYTNDGTGDGWLVLSVFDDVSTPTWSVNRRSGAWNVLSPLFNSRHAVLAKIDKYRRICESAKNLAYAEACDRLAGAELRLGIVDGPIASWQPAWIPQYIYEIVVRTVASRRGTLIALALSSYLADHGAYPAALEELYPAYLVEKMNDPFTDEPMRYHVISSDKYLLYSVGPNQIDDGGMKASRNREAEWEGDWVYSDPRPAPLYEPMLEEIEP